METSAAVPVTAGNQLKQICGCGTPREAIVWCYIHGYKIKPPVVRHGKVVARSAKASAEPELRRCKSGKKCLRFEQRKPAPAKGSGDYCSTGCAASDRARAKRAVSVVAPLVAQSEAL